MSTNGIDFTIKNQIVLLSGRHIILTSGKINDIHFIGNNIICSWLPHDVRKREMWLIPGKRLLPTLPPSLNFKIHNDELY